jgi:hypothetical protein
VGSPLADVLRNFLQPQQGAQQAPSAGPGVFGQLAGSLGNAAKQIQSAPKFQQQPQTTLNSGQPGAPAGIGHQFTPTAWTPPSEQRYSGPNPATQLQTLMQSQHPTNAAGHTLDWYKQIAAGQPWLDQDKLVQHMYDSGYQPPP